MARDWAAKLARELILGTGYTLPRGFAISSVRQVAKALRGERSVVAWADLRAAAERKTAEVWKADSLRLEEALQRVKRVACGEDQLDDDVAIDDTEALGWIYQYIKETLGEK
jgi:hypothetical protein